MKDDVCNMQSKIVEYKKKKDSIISPAIRGKLVTNIVNEFRMIIIVGRFAEELSQQRERLTSRLTAR